MKIVLVIVISLVALIGVVAIIGFLMPIHHQVSRSAEFGNPPDQVFALIANPDSYKSWWEGADVKSVIVEIVPPSKLVTRIVDETQFGGTWTFEIVAVPAGSRLTITERGEIYNVVFRALARYVFGYTATMDSFLEAVRNKLN